MFVGEETSSKLLSLYPHRNLANGISLLTDVEIKLRIWSEIAQVFFFN